MYQRMSSSLNENCTGAGGMCARAYLRLVVTLLLIAAMAGCATAPPAPPLPTASSSSYPAAGAPASTVAQPAPVRAPVAPTAAQAPVAEATAPQPTGSLWNEGNSSMFADIKAKNIGDVVTITVAEQATGSKVAATNTSRVSSLSGSASFDGVTAGGSTTPKGAFSFGPYQADFSNTFTGSGTTSRTDSMSAYMTATVIDRLPNGNLVIRGSRWTKVNNDLQQIVLEGVIRPIDITRDNTVLSQNIADAKIFLVGKGPIARQQKPGWLGQIVDFISPF